MSDPEPTPEQAPSAGAAQAASPADAAQPSPSPSPSPSPVPAPPPEQQPIELEQSQHQPQQDNTGFDIPDQQPLPPFQPLFTLVTDSTTGATHHARVHYIFSDDEPDLLTDALGQYSSQQQQQTASSSSGSTSAKPAPPTTDRAILLDLVPKPSANDPSISSSAAAAAAAAPGYEVAWASSLSADWAVVSAKVNPMSADDNDTADMTTTPARDAHGALMLRIEGVDLSSPAPRRTMRSKASAELSSGSSSGVGQPAHQEEYSAIVDEFDKRMVVLRKVLDAGRERQLKMAVDAGFDTGAGEPPAADMPGRSASHGSIGHDQPEDRPSGLRQTSDGSGTGQKQIGSKRLSGGSGGRTEWEQQPVG